MKFKTKLGLVAVCAVLSAPSCKKDSDGDDNTVMSAAMKDDGTTRKANLGSSFSQADADADGTLTEAEMEAQVTKKLQAQADSKAAAVGTQSLNLAGDDTDGDGTVSVPEAVAAHTKRIRVAHGGCGAEGTAVSFTKDKYVAYHDAAHTKNGRLHNEFDAADTDHDGWVSEAEGANLGTVLSTVTGKTVTTADVFKDGACGADKIAFYQFRDYALRLITM